MNKIPPEVRIEINTNPFYRCCARKGILGHVCDGRVTMEHAVIFAGRQVQKPWAIVPICAKGHAVDQWQDVGDLDKEVHLWIALNRAPDDELVMYSKAVDYLVMRERLNEKYGPYVSATEGKIQY